MNKKTTNRETEGADSNPDPIKSQNSVRNDFKPQLERHNGYQNIAVNTKDGSTATNSAPNGMATNIGDNSDAISKGPVGVAVNGGDSSISKVKNRDGIACTTGFNSEASVDGEYSVALAIGARSKAKGSLGSFLVLTEWKRFKDGFLHISDIQTVKVDGKRVKANTYYRLKKGRVERA